MLFFPPWWGVTTYIFWSSTLKFLLHCTPMQLQLWWFCSHQDFRQLSSIQLLDTGYSTVSSIQYVLDTWYPVHRVLCSMYWISSIQYIEYWMYWMYIQYMMYIQCFMYWMKYSTWSTGCISCQYSQYVDVGCGNHSMLSSWTLAGFRGVAFFGQATGFFLCIFGQAQNYFEVAFIQGRGFFGGEVRPSPQGGYIFRRQRQRKKVLFLAFSRFFGHFGGKVSGSLSTKNPIRITSCRLA